MAEPGVLQRLLPTPFVKFSAAVHLLGLGGIAVLPERWPLLAGAAVADHLGLLAAGMWPRSRLLGPNMRRLAGPEAETAVALTFDDGPDPEVTPRVLDILDAYQARATFFCIGRRAEAHPEIVEETVRRGHLVENHTYRHSNHFAWLGPRRLARELDRAQQVLEQSSGRRPVYFRAPAGIRSPLLEPLLLRRGLRLVSWTRRGFDTVARRTDRIVGRLTRDLSAGDILLLHDGSAARDAGGRAVTEETLPQVLERLAARGLRAISIPAPAPSTASR